MYGDTEFDIYEITLKDLRTGETFTMKRSGVNGRWAADKAIWDLCHPLLGKPAYKEADLEVIKSVYSYSEEM